MDSEKLLNDRIQRISMLLEMEFVRGPQEVRVAAGRVAHAMRFDDLPSREDLGLLLVFSLDQRARTRSRAEAGRQKEKPRKVKKRSSAPSSPKKKRRSPKDRPAGSRSVGKGTKPPSRQRLPDGVAGPLPSETAFSRLVNDGENDESTRRLRRKMGLSPSQVKKGYQGQTIIIGDSGERNE